MHSKFQLSSAEQRKITELLSASQPNSNQWILAKILLMRHKGDSYEQIATELNLQSSAVQYVLKRYRKLGLFQTFNSVIVDTSWQPQPEHNFVQNTPNNPNTLASVLQDHACDTQEYDIQDLQRQVELSLKLNLPVKEQNNQALTKATSNKVRLESSTGHDFKLCDRHAVKYDEPSHSNLTTTPVAPVAPLTSETALPKTEVTPKKSLSFIDRVKQIFTKHHEHNVCATFNPHAPLYESAVTSSKELSTASTLATSFSPDHSALNVEQSDEAKQDELATQGKLAGQSKLTIQGDTANKYSVSYASLSNSANDDISGFNPVKKTQGVNGIFKSPFNDPIMPTPIIPDMKIPSPSPIVEPTLYPESETKQGYQPELAQAQSTRVSGDDIAKNIADGLAISTLGNMLGGASIGFAVGQVVGKAIASSAFINTAGPKGAAISDATSFNLRGRTKFNISLTKDEQEQLKRIIDSNENSNVSELQKLRCNVLLLSSQGMPNNQIERELNLNRGFVSRVKRKFLDAGLDATLSSLGNNLFSEVYRNQVKQVIITLIQSTPQNYGYAQNLWTSSLVQDYLWKHCERMGMPDLLNVQANYFYRLMQQIIDDNPNQQFYVRMRSTREKEDAKTISSEATLLTDRGLLDPNKLKT